MLIHETLAYDRPETTESDNDEGGVQERKERNTKEGDVSTGTFKHYFIFLLYLYMCVLCNNYKLFNTKKKRQLIIFLSQHSTFMLFSLSVDPKRSFFLYIFFIYRFAMEMEKFRRYWTHDDWIHHVHVH